MLPYVLGAVLLSAVYVSADSNHECYWKRMDQVTIRDKGNWFQCKNTQQSSGGAQLCCRNGDTCGDDSLCHTNDISKAHSAWYVGGCSDGSYQDPVCREDCTKFKQTYIHWNTSQHLWDCCGDYDCDQDYSKESFKAVSPAQWEPIPQNGNYSPDENDNGIHLSTAAKAGIGAGAAAAVIAIVALIAVCCIRRRKPASRRTFNGGNKGTYAKLGPQHEMGGLAAGPSGYRSSSPAPASRGVSPARAPLVSNYGDGPHPNVAAQAAAYYPDQAAQKSTDEGA